MSVNKKALSASAIRDLLEFAKAKVEGEGLDLKAAIEHLSAYYTEREEKIVVHHEFKAFHTEALAAVHRVMIREYGYQPKLVNPFTGKPMTSVMLNVDLGNGETLSVTNSPFVLPQLEVVVHTRINGPFDFWLMGELKRKNETHFVEFCHKVEKEIKENSIYRGKMLELRFEWDDNAERDMMQVPVVINPPSLTPKDLILPGSTARYVDAELFQFVRHIAANRSNKLSMNRKVLLAGPYGTGKTLTASVLANVTKGEWTFLWFKPSTSGTRNPHDCLRQCLEWAKNYGPAILFQEDLDELLGRERDAQVNEVINTLDGIVGKDSEVLFVATTNAPESLDPVTLRRFDLLVNFQLPDAETAERLVRLYAGKILPPQEDLKQVGQVLEGHAPSVIASAVEAARRAATYRGIDTGTQPVLLTEDILVAAEGRAQHVALINRKPRVDRSEVEQVADSIVGAASIIVGKPNGHSMATSVRQ